MPCSTCTVDGPMLPKNYQQVFEDLLDGSEGSCCTFLKDLTETIRNIWACVASTLYQSGTTAPELILEPFSGRGGNNTNDLFDRDGLWQKAFCNPGCKTREPQPNPHINTLPYWVPENPGNDCYQDGCVVAGCVVLGIVAGKIIFMCPKPLPPPGSSPPVIFPTPTTPVPLPVPAPLPAPVPVPLPGPLTPPILAL
jgi:hypothetical protein